MKKKWYRALVPGIRIKLTLVTTLFVSLVIAVTSFFHYRQQRQTLEEAMEREAAAPLRFVTALAVERENLKRGIVSLEELRLRIQEKRKELGRYRVAVYRRKSTFGNTMRRFGSWLGMKVAYDYQHRSVDTHYSRYLSDKDITVLEERIKAQLLAGGSRAPADDLAKLKAAARPVAVSLLAIAALEAQAESAADAEAKRFARLMEGEEKKRAAAERSLDSTLNATLGRGYQSRAAEQGLTGDSVRIQSINPGGEIYFDTGSVFGRTTYRFDRLFRNDAYAVGRTSFIAEADPVSLLADGPRRQSYRVVDSHFEVTYRPVFKNPFIEEMARAMLVELRTNRAAWKRFLDDDRRISESIAQVAEKLTARVQALRKTPLVKPAADREYRSLYRDYQALVKQRAQSFAANNPHAKTHDQRAAAIAAERTALDARDKELRAAVGAFTPGQTVRVAPDGTEVRLEALLAERDRLKRQSAELAARRDDLRDSPERFADAIRHVRDAVVFSYVMLPYRVDPLQHERYLAGKASRDALQLRWAALRAWIAEGASETDTPSVVVGGRREPLMADGVLARSRSEAEEFLWKIDSLPLADDEGDHDGGIIALIVADGHIGYNAIFTDKTDGMRAIIDNRNEILRYGVTIALVAVVAIFLLSSLMVRRIRRIIASAELVGEGDLEVQFPRAGSDEIGTLSESLDEMVKGLRDREEMRGEMVAAEEIQRRLLPEAMPAVMQERLLCRTFYKAMRGAGGDYFDFIDSGEDDFYFCIGDVSSHGAGPAIVMALLRAQLRGIIRRGGRDMKKILTEINESVYADTPPHIFVTFVLLRCTVSTGEIAYCSAGHCPGLVYRANSKAVETLEGRGLPVGMDESELFETTIKNRSFRLDPGDMLFLYTDGLTEAMDPHRELFGEERLQGIIAEQGGATPSELVDVLVAQVERHTGTELKGEGPSQLNDDIAMIAIKRT